MINDLKTEILIVGSRQQLSKISINSIFVGDSTVQPLHSVRNLGSWFDSNMSMSIYVAKTCSHAFAGLYKIRQIRKFLNPESTKIIVHALVTSHLDHCNSLFFGIPKYQISSAARLIFGIPKFDHISSALFRLHWFPVVYRVQFKLLLLVYKTVNDQAPQYIEELLLPHSISAYSLLCCDQGLLFVPKTNHKTFGAQAFAHSRPLLWNNLLLDIRSSPNWFLF